MKGISKFEATRLFQEFGLEGLPAVIYDHSARPNRSILARDFPTSNAFMLRTGSRSEERNLPRRAGASLTEAEDWISRLSAHLDVVVQPYSPVVYSVEFARYGDGYLAELVPGIWELNTAVSPLVLTEREGHFTISGSLAPQIAAYHMLERGYYQQEECIQDWQVQALISWIRGNHSKLNSLQTRLGVEALGIKLHSALGYGLSPQNIRTNVPIREKDQPIDRSACLMHVTSVDDAITSDGNVFLDVSIAREDHSILMELVSRLVAANIQVVYLKSGLLSHLAITLREAGLVVRRINASVLRP